MDPAVCDDLENSLVLLTPSRPFSKDIKFKVYKRNTFFDMMYAFRYRRQADTNSKAVQFDAEERIQSGLMQIANTETQLSDHNYALPQASRTDCCTVSAAETQTTNSMCEDNCTDTIGKHHSEKCDFGVQVNMVQMGVVRPVVRRATTPEDTEKFLSGSNKQSERSQESANQSNEKSDDMKACKALHSHLRKLQNLVDNEAREKPTRCLNLVDNYLEHICEISHMIINSSELDEVLEFSRSTENKFSEHDDRMYTQTLIGENNAGPGSSTRPDLRATPEHVFAPQYYRNEFLQSTYHTRYRSPVFSYNRHEHYDYQARRNRNVEEERASLYPSQLGSLQSRIHQWRQVNRYYEYPYNRQRLLYHYSSPFVPYNPAVRHNNPHNMSRPTER